MRTIARLGVATATVALGASVALAGAGVATAAPVTTSANSVSVSGTTVSVSNKTAKDFVCSGIYGDAGLVAKLYSTALKGGGYTPSPAESAAFLLALQSGQIASVAGPVAANSKADLTTVPLSGVTLKPGGAAVVACDDGTTQYLLTTTKGGPLGSLDIGGSLGGGTGSLGS